MIFCIAFLRVIAALLITNSHYTGVYPTDLIANGGLLGDVIFFAVSGFCLYNIKMSFGKWYVRRILRVYTAPIIITIVYMIIGFYAKSDSFQEVIEWFIYPTNYHFVASIIVLYIPFYCVMKFKKFQNNIPWVMLGGGVVYLLIYIFVYDKSYYHIDNVREPMIRFLFFEAMLLGSYFKQHFKKFENVFKVRDWILIIGIFVLYFVSKILFVKKVLPSEFQIFNQMLLMVLLYFVMKCIIGIDSKLMKLPDWTKRVILYLSKITLEIYVVQYAIIPRMAHKFMFPLNWLLITVSIFIVAVALNLCVKIVNKQTDKLFIRTVGSRE